MSVTKVFCDCVEDTQRSLEKVNFHKKELERFYPQVTCNLLRNTEIARPLLSAVSLSPIKFLWYGSMHALYNHYSPGGQEKPL